MRIAIYPGSFDPPTKGHLDVIRRASALFDKLYVVILQNPVKKAVFSDDERMGFIKKSTKGLTNVFCDKSDGLTVDYAKSVGALFIVRGLRGAGDMEPEMQMVIANKCLAPEIDTVFFMTGAQYSHLSSTIVRDIGLLGGPITGFVPEEIHDEVKIRLKTLGEGEHK